MNPYRYFTFPKNVEKNLQNLKNKLPNAWSKAGDKKIINFANYVIKEVPAYRQFLKDNNCNISRIKNLTDFKKLPFTSKKAYLKKYSFSDLIPKEYLRRITTISSTSGSTGEPFYVPRGEEQDMQYEYIAELFLKNQFEIDKYSTLAINGFGLGIWIGGIFTYKNFNKIASRGYPLAVAPVGTNKEIFLKTFQKNADNFEQIILMGYPPFLRDVIDEAEEYNIKWSKYKLRIMTATEGYSEKFREYLIKKTGIKNRYLDVINIYGSVELGTMAHETSLTNLIRKIAVENPQVFSNVFPGAKIQPTLAQFHPHIVYFEEVGGEVFASGFGSSFPLLRYQFFDRGGVIPFNNMIKILGNSGIDILEAANKAGVKDTIVKLPFVYVYERSDFVVILRGANIYPENIKSALQEEETENITTGKFTMVKKENKNFDEYLEIHIEARKNVTIKESQRKNIALKILQSLLKNNSEFCYLYNTEGKKVAPMIVMHPYGDAKYFSPRIKQQWVRK